MSNPLNLRRRAFLWRLSIYLAAICSILALVFPARWLQTYLPWAPQRATMDHMPTSFPQASNRGHLQASPSAMPVAGSISFRGHRIPLPAGQWQPLIAGRTGPHGSEDVLSLARVDRNIVTGVIMIAASAHPMTHASLTDSFNLCDGTGNYASHGFKAETARGALECWFLAPSRTFNRAETQDLPDVIRAQLDALDLPYPSIFVRAQWIYAAPGGPDTFYPTAITLYLAPNEAGTLRLLAPKSAWNAREFANDAVAKGFISRTGQWFNAWIVIMRSALENGTNGGITPPLGSARDPAFPN